MTFGEGKMTGGEMTMGRNDRIPCKQVVNPFSAKDILIDFTLSNARRFYSAKGNPLALKGLIHDL